MITLKEKSNKSHPETTTDGQVWPFHEKSTEDISR